MSCKFQNLTSLVSALKKIHNLKINFVWIQLCKSSTMKCEDILSKANKENCIKLLKSNRTSDFFTSKSQKKAAVLVPLCQFEDNLSLLYTVRALHLKVNGGEIAFPGGRFDESDRTLENTALREAHEEVGIHPNKVEIWGAGPEIHRPDIVVTPILGYIGPVHLNKIKINANEVSLAFLASLKHLSSPENFRVTRFRRGKNYVYQTPVYLKTSKRIWGLTAYITHIMLSSLIPDIYKANIKFNPGIQQVLQSEKMIGGEKKSASKK